MEHFAFVPENAVHPVISESSPSSGDPLTCSVTVLAFCFSLLVSRKGKITE